MKRKYKVTLTEEEQLVIEGITKRGRHSARKINRAKILSMSSEQNYSDEQMASLLTVSISTIYRTRKAFVEYGLTEALEEGSRSGQPRKLDAKQEALLIATACTEAPSGYSRWTLNLLGERLIALTDIESVAVETIRRRLKENDLKPWQKKMWCIASLDAEYIARMEDVLDLYAEEPDPLKPVVNFDEAGKQLVKEVNEPIQAKSGQVAREDYEYERAGVRNIFMHFDRHNGWRKAVVTENKTALDFANCMRELVDTDYPDAEVIRVVLDNFSTHSVTSLYKAFPAKEALRIAKKLEFHFTPKHASWLNMAEIEIGNMNRECLDRRIPSKEALIEELDHWQKRKNNKRSTIHWMFNVEQARDKFRKAYNQLTRQN